MGWDWNRYQKHTALYAASLELLNDLETHANHAPGLSGAVLSSWMAGEPLQPGDDSHLLPEHASLGQAIVELRALSRRLARLVGLVNGGLGIHSRV